MDRAIRFYKEIFGLQVILDQDGNLNLNKFKPIIYDSVHHGYYEMGKKVGQAFKDGLALK